MKTTLTSIITIILLLTPINLASQPLLKEWVITIQTKPGSIELPDQVDRATLDELEGINDGLVTLFTQFNILEIERAITIENISDTVAISRTGERVRFADMSNTFNVSLPVSIAQIDEFIEKLVAREEIIYADIFIGDQPSGISPDDTFFSSQWAVNNTGQLNGTPGADINATKAWEITTGSSSTIIGIYDGGVENWHEDLQGKVTANHTGWGWDGHGFNVAGIAAAQTDNDIGVAGVDWNAQIHSWRVDNNTSFADHYNDIMAMINDGVHIINMSFSHGVNCDPVYSTTVRKALANAYNMNIISVASMDNCDTDEVFYPAGYGQGIIAVGASDQNDERWECQFFQCDDASNFGDHIDVVAPGRTIRTTHSQNTTFGLYISFNGTSAAAPHVSGIAGLLLSENPNLYNDDVQQLIRLSADKVGSETYNSNGFNQYMGYGRVNAYEALKRLQSPYILDHKMASNGTVYDVSGRYNKTMYGIPGLADGTYSVKRHEIRKSVSFPWIDESYVWGRGAAATGYSAANHNFGMGYTDVISSSENSALLRTYVYEIWTIGGAYLGWVPTKPENVEFAYTVHGIPGEEPLSVQIVGPTQVQENDFGMWGSSVSGGNPPYTYTWRRSYSSSTGPWTQVGTSSGYSQTVTQDMWLKLTVSDSGTPLSNIAHSTQQVQVLTCSNPPCPIPKVIASGGESIPESYALSQNYPNPFNPATTINYELPERADVNLAVYNMLGQRVALLVDGDMQPGRHETVFEASNLSSGNYIARFTATENSGEQFTQTLNMQLVK